MAMRRRIAAGDAPRPAVLHDDCETPTPRQTWWKRLMLRCQRQSTLALVLLLLAPLLLAASPSIARAASRRSAPVPQRQQAICPTDLTLFDMCARPLPPDRHRSQSSSPSPCGCSFLRPYRYFFGPDGDRTIAFIRRTSKQSRPWVDQVNSFPGSTEPLNDRWTAAVGGPNEHDGGGHGGPLSSVSCLMIPKVASRTIHSLFLDVLSTKNPRVARRVGQGTDEFWSEVEQRQRTHRLQLEEALEDAAVTERQEVMNSPPTKNVVFAVVRDPVSRFLSSVSQLLSLRFMKRCTRCPAVLNPCVELAGSSYRHLLRCVIDAMLPAPNADGGTGEGGAGYFDEHLVPQSAFLAGGLGLLEMKPPPPRDVEVAVFHLESGGLDRVLAAFGVEDGKMRLNQRDSKTVDADLLERFGKDILHNPKVARAELDEQMVRDICDLYRMDVELLQHLGFSVGPCDNGGR